MISKISRIALIAITIFVTAILYPQFYKTSFRRNVSLKSLNYSEVLDDFLIVGTSKEPIYDRKGNVYSVADYQSLIPLGAFRHLISKGLMPDSLKGVELTFDNIAASTFDHKIQLGKSEREYGLLPLMHGSSTEYGHHHRGDFMRINKNGVQFINSATNKIDEEKSELFNSALTELSYAPPAVKMWGSVVPGGERYNGVFFTDKNNNLFQVNYFDEKPLCNKIELPYEMEIIKVYNLARDGQLAYLFNSDNEIFLLDNQRVMHKIPSEGFDYNECWNVELSGNLFYNFISFRKEGYEKLIVMDKSYSYLDSYALVGELYSQTAEGRVESFLYPFKIERYTYKNGFNFTFKMLGNYNFLLLNIILVFILYYIKRRDRSKLLEWSNIFDILLVAFFGIYAFTGILIFKVK